METDEYEPRVLPILLFDRPEDAKILLTPCEPYKFENADETMKLALDLAATMKAHKGLGLAANQVGISKAVFVLNVNPCVAMFNPRLVDVSAHMVLLEESCLSAPGLVVKVKRPQSVKVRYQDVYGDFHTEIYTGITARVIVHEMSHLKGERFYDSASRYHRDQGMRKKKLLDRRLAKIA